MLYIVGPIWILLVAILSMFLARFSRLDHAFAALGIVALLLLFISLGQQTTDRSQGRLEWFLKWSVFYLSLYAMTIAAAKLGRIAGVALGDSRA